MGYTYKKLQHSLSMGFVGLLFRVKPHRLLWSSDGTVIKKYGCVLMTGMQTPPPTPPLKKDRLKKVVMNRAECSEQNGKNNEKKFRLFFSSYHQKLG